MALQERRTRSQVLLGNCISAIRQNKPDHLPHRRHPEVVKNHEPAHGKQKIREIKIDEGVIEEMRPVDEYHAEPLLLLRELRERHLRWSFVERQQIAKAGARNV